MPQKNDGHSDDGTRRVSAWCRGRTALQPKKRPVGNHVANSGNQASFIVEIDLDEVAGGGRDDVLGLRDRTGANRPVDLDHQLPFVDAERKGTTVTDVAVTAGKNPDGHVFDEELVLSPALITGGTHPADPTGHARPVRSGDRENRKPMGITYNLDNQYSPSEG